MGYSITTQDGITINNIPDNIAPDAPELKTRVANLRATRGGGEVVKLSLPSGYTTGNNKPAPRTQKASETFSDKLVGAGEAALAAGTGLTAGGLSGMGGFIQSLLSSMKNRTYGTPQAADLDEQNMDRAAQAVTYAPRTPAGQRYTEKLGDFANEVLAPATGLTAQLGAIGRATKMAAPVVKAQADEGLRLAAGRSWNKLTPEQKALATASFETGIPLTKGELINSTTRNLAAKTVSKAVTGAAPAKKLRDSQRSGYEAAVSDAVNSAGTAMEPAALGDFAQQAMESHRGRIKGLANRQYGARDEIIGKNDVQTATPNIANTIERIKSETSDYALGVDSSLKQTIATLDERVQSGGFRPKELTAMKKQLNDLISANSEKDAAGNIVSVNNNGRFFSMLKDAADKDLSDYSKNIQGGRASTLDRRANRLWGYQEQLYGGKGAVKNPFRGDPEDFLDKVFSANSVKEAQALKKAVGKNDMGNIQATAIKKIVGDSPAKFVTNMEKYNPEVLSAFFEPQQLDSLNKLYSVAKRIKTTSKEWENPSGTAAIVLNSGIGAGTIGAAITNPALAVGNAIAAGALYPVSRILHSPYSEAVMKAGAKGAKTLDERAALRELLGNIPKREKPSVGELLNRATGGRLASIDGRIGLGIKDVSDFEPHPSGLLNNDPDLRNSINNFIMLDSPIKSKYKIPEADVSYATDKAFKFIKEFGGYTKESPLIGKYGHKISFEPDSRAVVRLGEKDATIENALHYVTQIENGGDYTNRVFSQSKADTVGTLRDILENADAQVAGKNGEVYYYRKIRESSKRPYAEVLLRLIPAENGTYSPDVYRFTSLMPDKKKIRIP